MPRNNMQRVGAVATSNSTDTDDRQAASIGATIRPDGWWYRNGQRLSHDEADRLVREAGTAQEGLQEWGLGRGTWGDITGGRIGDVHIPPAIAEGLRAAAAIGGSFLGIPPQVTYALANNLGKGSVTMQDVLKYTTEGAIKGAIAGGAAQGAQAASPGLWNGVQGAAQGAARGAMNPMGNYTSGANAGRGLTLQDLGMSDIAQGGASPAGDASPAGGAISRVGNGAATPGGAGSPSFKLPQGLTWGDILKAGGSLGLGIVQSNAAGESRRQSATESNRNFERGSQDRLINIDDRIQRAPMRDRAQYLAMNRAAPTPFQPRDFTRGGMGVMQSQAQGGPTQQLQANANAAANYRPGAGGYNTETLEMIRRRMLPQAGV